MDQITCARCGAVGLQAGYLSDVGQGARGFGEWIAGALERGPLGGAKRFGRPRRAISAYRCPMCSHLELFAP